MRKKEKYEKERGIYIENVVNIAIEVCTVLRNLRKAG